MTFNKNYEKIGPTWTNFRQKLDRTRVHKDAPKSFRNHALVLYKKTLVLKPLQKQILIGPLLGDASLGFPGGPLVHKVD